LNACAPLGQSGLIKEPSEILLDVTRLLKSRWKRQNPTGLDRVALAYAEHYRDDARAVLQHRGLTRVLGEADSRRLFDLLLDRKRKFRRAFTGLVVRALARSSADNPSPGALYLNVGHTEFDLPEHINWVNNSGVKPVYFLHDLIPIRRPDLCLPNAVARHKARVDSALANGAAIIVNSNATAADLQQYAAQTGQTPPPVLIAALAGGDVRTTATLRMEKPEPYFLAVGTHEPRRNFSLLVTVWDRLAEEFGDACPKLTIVGQAWKRHPESFRALQRRALRSRHLQLIEDCSDQELGDLMAGARALVMPTLAEGFGLPLVEALALGTPVIASDLPSLRESGQGIPLLLDPAEPAMWENAIIEFEQNPSEWNRQREMLKTYRAPSWDDHFAQVAPFLADLEATAFEGLTEDEVQCLTA